MKKIFLILFVFYSVSFSQNFSFFKKAIVTFDPTIETYHTDITEIDSSAAILFADTLRLIDDQGDSVKIFIDGSNNLTFYDQVIGTKTLAQLFGAAPVIDSTFSGFLVDTLFVGDSTLYIINDGSGNLKFYDQVTGTKTLAELASGSGGGWDSTATSVQIDTLNPYLGSNIYFSGQMSGISNDSRLVVEDIYAFDSDGLTFFDDGGNYSFRILDGGDFQFMNDIILGKSAGAGAESPLRDLTFKNLSNGTSDDDLAYIFPKTQDAGDEGKIEFGTGNGADAVTRMILGKTGNLRIGDATNPSSTGSGNLELAGVLQIQSDSTSHDIFVGNTSGSWMDAGDTQFTAVSDTSKKENIDTMFVDFQNDPDEFLDRFYNVRPISYNLKRDSIITIFPQGKFLSIIDSSAIAKRIIKDNKDIFTGKLGAKEENLLLSSFNLDSVKQQILYDLRVEWYEKENERAERISKKTKWGFTAQEFNNMFLDDPGINWLDGDKVRVAQWQATRLLINEVNSLKRDLADIKTQISQNKK